MRTIYDTVNYSLITLATNSFIFSISYLPTNIKAAAINPINTEPKRLYIVVRIIQTMQAQLNVSKSLNTPFIHPI